MERLALEKFRGVQRLSALFLCAVNSPFALLVGSVMPHLKALQHGSRT